MKLLSYFIIIMSGWTIGATAAVPTEGINQPILKEIKTHTADNGNFEAELYFDKPVFKDQVTFDYINDTIQVNLSDVKLSKRKMIQNVTDEKIKSLYTYKTGLSSVRTRITYKKGIDASQYIASADANKNVLTIHVGYGANIEAQTAPAVVPEQKKDISDDDLKAAAAWIEKADKQGASKVTDKKSVVTKSAESKESEIPVLLGKKTVEEGPKTTSSSRVLLSLGLVLALISGFSFFMKKFLKKTPLNRNSQIKILTQHYIGPKKSLAIIQVAGESVLVGITEHNINLIKTLALLDEEIPQDTPKDFSKSLKNIFKREDAQEQVEAEVATEKDDFAFSKIREAISGKLKNMKEI